MPEEPAQDEMTMEFHPLVGTPGSYAQREGVDYGALLKMREEFPDSQIGQLPQPITRHEKTDPKYVCRQGHPDADRASIDGIYCGGKHWPSIHLSFVGHAALTARLIDADPAWEWQPLAFDPDGLPKLDREGGLWIRLTVGGVTRLGYGDAPNKQGSTAIKEIIGDALRNAGMRFGAALSLWHKGDLFDNAVDQGKVEAPSAPSRARPASAPDVVYTDEQRKEALAFAMDGMNVTSLQLGRKHYIRLRVMGFDQEVLDTYANRVAQLPDVPQDTEADISPLTVVDQPQDDDTPMALS